MPEAHIDPTREQFDAFKALPRDAPIAMLNLVRYRERAAYPDGHGCAALGLTGAEAYAGITVNYGDSLLNHRNSARTPDPET